MRILLEFLQGPVESKEAPATIKNYLPVAFIALLSFLLITAMNKIGVAVVPAKLIAETILFFVSFTFQRDIVFNKRENE